MTEQEILAYFNNRIAPPPSQNLHRIQILCHALGDPQKKLAGKIIHVAGTNGKGSVCAFLDAILRAAGKHTGLYISPFIHRFEERIQIDKTPVSLDEIAAYIPQLRAAELSLYAQTGERAGHFELLFDFDFNRQSVSIPACLTVHLIALHCLVTVYGILEGSCHYVMYARFAVGRRRTFIEVKCRHTLSC